MRALPRLDDAPSNLPQARLPDQPHLTRSHVPTRRPANYVWRHYLEGWQAQDTLVASLIGDKLTRTRPSNIMVQRDFYRVRRPHIRRRRHPPRAAPER